MEEAVKYIIFLVDANTLFDVALGMYDFELVLLIAQHAQKVSPCPSTSYPLSLQKADRYGLAAIGPARIPPLPPRASSAGEVLPEI